MSPVKKIMFYFTAGALFILSLIIVFKDNGLLDLKKQRGELSEAIRENEELRQKNKVLFHEVQRLKKDDAYLEYIARKELGMIKSDEIVVQFHADKKK